MPYMLEWQRWLPLALLFFVVQCAAESDDPSDGGKNIGDANLQLEASVGRERYSSPLVRFNEQGPLMQIIGRNQLSGNYLHVGGSGMRSFVLTEQLNFQLSGNLMERRFDRAGDLDLGVMSLDGMMHYKLAGATVGLGPSWQRISTGGQHFRERHAVQMDWVRVAEGDGYTSIVAETGLNQHADAFRDFDSRSSLLLVRKQFLKPLRGLDEFSVEVGGVREANRQGNDDLSSRQWYVRMGSEFVALGVTWSLSGTYQRARFDAPTFDGQPARRDTFLSGDLNASYALSKALTLRLNLSQYDNRANLPVYEGTFKGNSLSLIYNH